MNQYRLFSVGNTYLRRYICTLHTVWCCLHNFMENKHHKKWPTVSRWQQWTKNESSAVSSHFKHRWVRLQDTLYGTPLTRAHRRGGLYLHFGGLCVPCVCCTGCSPPAVSLVPGQSQSGEENYISLNNTLLLNVNR